MAETFDNKEVNQLIYRVKEDENFEKILDEGTEGNLTTVSLYKRVYVGGLDANGVVHISEKFKLMGNCISKLNYAYGNTYVFSKL